MNVRRSQLLLATAQAVYSSSVQLAVALSTVTFVLVTGFTALLGIGPAIFLTSAALAAFPAGRAMDRVGRVPVLAAGYLAGAAGGVTTALGVRSGSGVVVICGFVLIGCANGTIQLLRTAAGDLVPPSRRARGIAVVLVGSIAGALLGPLVFSPLFAGKDLGADALFVPWLASAGLMLLGLAVVLCVRPDPKRVAEEIGGGAAAVGEPAPLREIVRRPGAIPALVGAQASYAVMTSVMNLTGYVVVHEHGHAQSDVFPIIAAHVVGMYGLVLVIGPLIDAIGRTRALTAGLFVMGVSVASLLAVSSVHATAMSLMGLGIGWNIAFVAATAELSDLTSPAERGRLLGTSDLVSSLLGASLALAGGYALAALGVVAIAVGGTVLAVLPGLWIATTARRTVALPA
ncbi:MAG TPA: MFS transporter [Gaiellaceae bacterium]|nr:MFS transporter [Gaiellaceae bacterium]